MSEVISNQVLMSKVLFSKGITSSTSCIQWVEKTDTSTYVIVDQTPFHPVSHIWPDHPADKGFLVFEGKQYTVTDCVTGAFDVKNNKLYKGRDIPVKRGEEGWHFVVVHELASDLVLNVSDTVELNVDEGYQAALSRGHSAGHLASYALNKVLEQTYWRKDASRKDVLNNRDFHSYAQVLSLVSENKSTDSYRLGKTLKKRGLNVAEMLADLALIETKVNDVLAIWLETKAPVVMKCEGDALTDSRYWCCDLGLGESITMPCGGSHVRSLAEYKGIQIALTLKSEQDLEMITTAS
ncbi:MAG: metal-dependent hydrolase [Moritella sp.]|uniref:alanyl-tRNA editing protein n=1 Tax=Moritella sp. TaxID=78556 RepID=UPI000C0EA4C6|nr:alanyl-tRNA editing protein [Moritella sp.]MBL1415848.1 alanyl-tRNA editing protein [Moritella sp.]PHR89150.1 MAG: metal-dependent hydrolase [Moritella sp.]